MNDFRHLPRKGHRVEIRQRRMRRFGSGTRRGYALTGILICTIFSPLGGGVGLTFAAGPTSGRVQGLVRTISVKLGNGPTVGRCLRDWVPGGKPIPLMLGAEWLSNGVIVACTARQTAKWDAAAAVPLPVGNVDTQGARLTMAAAQKMLPPCWIALGGPQLVSRTYAQDGPAHTTESGWIYRTYTTKTPERRTSTYQFAAMRFAPGHVRPVYKDFTVTRLRQVMETTVSNNSLAINDIVGGVEFVGWITFIVVYCSYLRRRTSLGV